MNYDYTDYTNNLTGYGKTAQNPRQRKNQGRKTPHGAPSPDANIDPERISSRIIIADSAQPVEEAEKKDLIFKMDGENIISGIIFSEILGKPRAKSTFSFHHPARSRFRRG